MSKTRIVVQLGDGFYAGRRAKKEIFRTLAAYIKGYVYKETTTLGKLKEALAAMPISHKGLWLFQEPKGIPASRSRYIQICKKLGIGIKVHKKQVGATTETTPRRRRLFDRVPGLQVAIPTQPAFSYRLSYRARTTPAQVPPPTQPGQPTQQLPDVSRVNWYAAATPASTEAPQYVRIPFPPTLEEDDLSIEDIDEEP